MKKLLASVVIVAAVSLSCVLLYGADEATAKAPAVAAARPAAARTGADAATRRPNFAIIFGSITKVDNSDPAKPKLEVKSDADGTTHKVDITPWTNVTKVTDMSELKAGDSVRIMARKVENSEVAMTVVFGKIKNVYAPRPAAGTPAAKPAPAAAKK